MNDYTFNKTYFSTAILFLTLFLVGIAFSQSPTKPTLALVEDTGTDASDKTTDNSAITISNLTEGNSWSFSTDSGSSWITGDDVGSSGTVSFDPAFAITGSFDETIAAEVSATAIGAKDSFESNSYDQILNNVFFFDVTMPATLTSSKEVLVESGGDAVGIVIFTENGALKTTIADGSHESELTLSSAFTANTRYWIVVEMKPLDTTANTNTLTYYIAEKGSDDNPTVFTQFATKTNAWTGTDWCGGNAGGWGQTDTDGNAQGPEETTYANFTGTFHAGKFYSNKSFDDLWKTEGAATTSVTVRHTAASDSSSTTDSDAFTFTRDNVGPPITSDATVTVLEGNGVDEAFYTITTSETGSITYDIEGADVSSFTLEGAAGVKFNTAPDYETKSSYTFTATATDAAGNKSTQEVVVTVTDHNEAPTFTSDATFNIRENWSVNSVVFTVVATDPENNTLTYSLTGSNVFSINSSTGEVTLQSALDYESDTKSYTLTATVQDNGFPNNTETQEITVTVTDVTDETPPSKPTIALQSDSGSSSSDGVTNNSAITISSLTEGNSWSFSTDSGSNWIAGDEVESSGTVSFDPAFAISGSFDETIAATASASSISTEDSFGGSEDYDEILTNVFFFDVTMPATLTSGKEVLVESGGSSTGIVIFTENGALKITIGGGSDESELTLSSALSAGTRYWIMVEMKPLSAADSTNTLTYYIAEKDGSDDPTVFTQFATKTNAWTGTDWCGSDSGGWGRTDADGNAQGPNGTTYVNFSGTFHAGKFYSNKSFDDLWKTEGTGGETSITVRHTDTSFNIKDSDAFTFTRDNIEPPITSSATATAIDENSGTDTSFYTITTSEAGSITYGIEGADAGSFTLEGAGVKFNTAPDHETKDSYTFTATATDAAGNKGSITVSLSINDLADDNPVFTSGATATVAENQTSTGYTAAATPDVSGATVTYSLNGGDDQDKFEINSSSGVLTFKTAPDYENPQGGSDDDSNNYVVIVEASDATNTATQTVTVTVTDVDDTAPAKPAITFTDNGDSTSDGITNDASLTISDLEVGATLELSRNNGTNWLTYGEITTTSMTIDGSKLAIPGTLDDSPTEKQTEVTNTDSLKDHSGDLPDSFYFDITMPDPLTSDKEIIYETGGTGIGVAFFSEGGTLKGSIFNNNDASDLTAENVFEAGKRYAILIEFTAGHDVKYYVAEKLADALPANFGDAKATGSDILDGVNSSTTWSGSDGAGWGQVNATAQGDENTDTYVSFTGTFHEGRFYNGKSYSDIWNDLDESSPQTLVDTTQQSTIVARQTDTTGNVSEVSDGVMIQLTTLNVDTIAEEKFFYTNPVTNMLELVSESPIKGVRLYSLSGQKVLEVSSERTKLTLDISSLATGLYVMKVITQTSEKTVKLVKE